MIEDFARNDITKIQNILWEQEPGGAERGRCGDANKTSITSNSHVTHQVGLLKQGFNGIVSACYDHIMLSFYKTVIEINISKIIII